MAAIYAMLFGISAMALIVFLWWATAGLLDRQVEAAIHSDVQGLSEHWEEGGIPALVDTIHQRMANGADAETIYLLADVNGNRIAGNLERWPPSLNGPNPPRELVVSRGGARGLSRVVEYEVPGGYRLLVGRDVRVRARLQSLLADTLVWALALVLALGFAGALLMRQLFRHMLANVSVTARAISGGDLSRRIKLSGRNDEFDGLAATINDMLDRIKRLMDGVRQVSDAIAHDLRTPIARARARLEDAATHAGSEADLRAAIERAIADLDGIVGVFQALLRIAEIEAGARRSAFAEIDLGPMLHELAELYGAVAEECGLTFRLDAPAHLLLAGDREMLQQAVANLLDNAVKFSPKAGRITLRAFLNNQVQIEVSDTGPGIPAEDRFRATERFYRGELARNAPGSGLGLAVVQAVAQLHGGSFTLADAAPGLRAVLRIPTPNSRPCG